MKQSPITHNLAAKVTAIIAVTLLFWIGAALIGSSLLAVAMADSAGDAVTAQRNAAGRLLDMVAHRNVNYAYANAEYYKLYLDDLPFPYTVTDNDREVLSTYDGGGYFASGRRHLWYDLDRYIDTGEPVNGSERPPQDGVTYGDDEIYSEEHLVTVTLYVTEEQLAQDRSWFGNTVRAVGRWHRQATARFVIGGVCELAALAALIFLYAAAGRRAGEEQPRCNAVDRIPFDLFTALATALVILLTAGIYGMLYELGNHTYWLYIVLSVLAVVCMAVAEGLVLLGYTMSIATRAKTHTLWRNTLVWRLLHLIYRLFAAIPLIPKTLLCIAGVALQELIVLAIWGNSGTGEILLGWLLDKVIAVPLIIWLMVSLRRLQIGAHEIAAGNIHYTVSTDRLPGDLRRAATDLNHIGDGLQTAVEARLRSERLKTELITNVSHDIKTPLTSIINYVDLLAKEPLPEGPSQEYIDVLQRQSGRLKKLVEDLVEASKASTGNLSVTLAPCRLEVLMEQTLGEYASRAEAAGLDMRLTRAAQPLEVLADERHMGRILDNLMSNICKYAMPGTRVYLDLTAAGDQAQITFRNVSKAALHISGEELAERFVRGDSSRNTEGSGLGLSIARSLAELQGGSLQVTVDGDLFKVALQFPLAPATDRKKEV